MHRYLRIAIYLVAAIAIVYAVTPLARNHLGGVGEPAQRAALPDFALPLLNGGGDWKLSEHRGTVVLLNFWATWCPPCRTETPGLVNLHNRYSQQGFTVLGVTFDEEPLEAVPDFERKYNISYPMALPHPGFEMAGEVRSLPTSVLIDRQGRVARTYQGLVAERALRRDIEALLAE
jgi:cytochrome c biogenesis protein CcmG, thiol:disulfide interchange protein DsbE